MLANANTGLPSQKTFYIGHLQGKVNGLAVVGASGALQVTKSSDPTATSASSLLTASSNRTNLDGSFSRIASKQSADSGTEKAVPMTAADGNLNVHWRDDFFASFDDRKIK